MAPKSVILALCDFLKGDGEDTPIAIQKKPASDAKSPSNPKKRPAAALVLSKKTGGCNGCHGRRLGGPYSKTISNHINTGFVITITSI
jgi:mono/diheme cytochrome c family protein